MRNVAQIKYLIASNKEALKEAPKNGIFQQMIEDCISRLETELVEAYKWA